MAQEPHFRHYNASNGLRGSLIFRVLEEGDGKLLLFTNKGLYHYNGAEFKPAVKSDTLSDKVFFHYQEDTIEKCYWLISTNDQLFRYKNGKLTLECPQQYFCWMDIEPRTGKKWLMNRDGEIFSLNNGKASLLVGWKYTPELPKERGNIAITFLSLGNNHFMLGSLRGFYHLSPKGQEEIRSIRISNGLGTYPRIFRKLNGDYLLANGNGLYRYDPLSQQATRLLDFSQKEIISFYEDNVSADIWLGTSQGVYHFRSGRINQTSGIQYLQSFMINSIFKDAEGIYWFGTADAGMQSCDLRASHYRWMEQATEKAIAFVKKDGNLMYAFSQNGDAFYLENGKMNRVFRKKRGFGSSGNIMLINAVQDGGICVMADGVYSVIRNKKEVPNTLFTYAEMNGNYYYYIKDMGVIKEKGAVEYRSGKEKKIIVSKAHWASLLKKYPFARGLGPWYFDLRGAVYYYDKEKRNMVKITPIRGGEVTGVMIPLNARPSAMSGLYNDSIILIPTEGKGLALYVNNHLKWIREEDGLLSNFCKKIKSDGQYVWVCTDVGLSRLSINAKGELYKVTNFTSDNTLLRNDVNDVEIMNDTAYVASSAGVSRFWKHMNTGPVNYHCYVEKLEINTRDTMVGSGYILPYDQNNLTVTLAQSSRQVYDHQRYKYVLWGGEKDTQMIHSNTLNLASVQPGDYTLSMWSCNINGGWSAAPAKLSFTINAPFWKTSWFRMSVGGVCIAIVFAVVYAYQRRQRRKAEVARMLVESDLRSLRLHMNPHFIFNSLTSLQSFIVTQKTAQAEMYISQFSQMIRSVMSYSVVGEITLAEEVEFLKQYIELELIRFDDQFEYSVSVAEDIQPGELIIPSLLIQPLVENAIKHGLTGLNRKSTLSIHFAMNGGRLYCEVEDNGRGRSDKTSKFNKVSGHVSTGIKFTEERIRLLVKDDAVKPITIVDMMTDGKPTGTRVIMVVPILE